MSGVPCNELSDVNNDGLASVIDVFFILSLDAGLIDTLPAEGTGAAGQDRLQCSALAWTIRRERQAATNPRFLERFIPCGPGYGL